MSISSEELTQAMDELARAELSAAAVIEQLAAATSVSRADIDSAIEQLVVASRRVRTLVDDACARLGIQKPLWTDKSAMRASASALSAQLATALQAASRQRLLRVADELHSGTVAHRQAARQARLDAQRLQALAEVTAQLAREAVALPWPEHDVPNWVRWVLLLEEPLASEVHSRVQSAFPRLTDLLTSLEPETWRPMEPSAQVEPTPDPSPPSEPPPPVSTRRHPILQATKAGPPSRPPSILAQPLASILAKSVEAPITAPTFTEEDSYEAPEETGPVHLAPVHEILRVIAGHPQPGDRAADATGNLAKPNSPGPTEAVLAAVTRAVTASAIDSTTTRATAHHQSVEAVANLTPAPPSAIDSITAAPPLPAPSPVDDERRAPGRRPTPAQVAAVAPITIPNELLRFDAYRSAFWRAPDGRVTHAPWTDGDYAGRLEAAAEAALGARAWSHLILHVRAAAQLGLESIPRLQDIETTLAIITRPDVEITNGEPERGSAIQALDGRKAPSFALRLRLFLEALSPAATSRWDLEVVGERLASAAFGSKALSSLLEAAFRVGAEGESPLSAMRGFRTQSRTTTPEALAIQLSDARVHLRESVRHMWSAAGGRIATTHCREIWQQFMTEAQSVFHGLADGTSGHGIEDVRAIDTLAASYERLANRGGAKYADRNKMNRAASQLLEAARAVVFSARRLDAHRRRTAPASRAVEDLARAFLAIPQVESTSGCERVYLGLLDELLAEPPPPTGVATVLTYDDFARRPALLETVPVLATTDDGDFDVDARDVSDPIAASAHLILPEYANAAPPSLPMAERLRDLDRDDLLLHVQPVSDREARHASAALIAAQVELWKKLDTVRRIGQQLQQAASIAAPQLSAIATEAERLARVRAPHETKPELIADWLSRASQIGASALSQAVDTIRTAAGALVSDRRDDVLTALKDARIADAVALLRGHLLQPPSGLNATLRRSEVGARFPNPRQTLENVRGDAERLGALWIRGIRANTDDDELRAAFAAFVFEPISRRFKGAVAERKGGRTVVATQTMRQWLAQTGHNPSFVPQVTAFNTIVVMTPPVSPANDAFVSRAAELATTNDPRILVILAPGITRSVRESFRDEVRRRNHLGVALVDDIDLLRLLNPGGQLPDLPLGLLEIILEQQTRWSKIGPFETHEGQHTKPEMYVGRREEADRLARTASYSRVFSGRRLGKSALLKHIRDTQSDRKLPSKNVLMVIYAPIVGVDDEDQVVERIRRAFADQLDYSPTLFARSANDRLAELTEGFLHARARESVLVFLDESDMFVETQIRRYETERERCLSWVMRTMLEAHKDSMDHPRIRFVFAGYRATHLSEGAWANWGDVLRLQPLTADEASRLVAGPLARLGIDANSEAGAISFRCGYQPAVIVRFGQQLLEYLDSTTTPAAREHTVVTAEQVAHVYQGQAVQQEIRTIVWNNFQGNPFGKVVFAALLVAFARLPPGAPLEDAPRQVLERLREISPDFLNTGSAKGAPLDRVARELREFVGRSLLVDASATIQSQGYQLRFPHHLPVLLQEDQESVIRREVEALGSEPVDNIEVVRSLLTNTALDEIAEALSPIGIELGVSVAVAGSHWLDALDAGAARLTNRLGLVAEDILEVRTDDVRGLRERHRAALGATAALADAVVARRVSDSANSQAAVLLIGGVDLVRWAARRRIVAGSPDTELAVVERVGHAQLRWWFERVRAIDFAGVNPTARFLEVTGGIPFLLSLLDKELGTRVSFQGETAPDSAVDATLSAFHDEFEAHVARLARGSDSERLEWREIELLIMYVRASQEFRETPVIDVMREWHTWAADGFAPELSDLTPLEPSDAAPMEVLLRAGLIPTDARAARPGPFDRVAVLGTKDPLHAIAAVLQRCRSS